MSTLDLAREEVNRVKEVYRKLLEKETQAIVAAEFYGGPLRTVRITWCCVRHRC